jgi:peptidyl-dipeptidase Dcp
MTKNQNPFLTAYNTPHETIPFHLIKTEHFEPAVLVGMEEQNREIEEIINNPETPTFTNTIVALERSGKTLDRITTVFGNLLSAETNDEMQAIAERIMPQLTEHSNNISLNEKLFSRIKSVYESEEKSSLNQEEKCFFITHTMVLLGAEPTFQKNRRSVSENCLQNLAYSP